MTKQSKRLLWQIPFLLFLVVATFLIIRQRQTTPFQRDSGFIFGTMYNVTYQSSNNLKAEIEAELKKVDASLSMFNEQSTLSKINRNESVETDDMFREVFSIAQNISKETDGNFDITVAPLVNTWGFGFKHDAFPDSAKVDSLRMLVGFEKVKIVKGKVEKQNPQMIIDFGAIAKGYGCDIVARLLNKRGVDNFLIEIGGEVVAKGLNPEQQKWRIGVAKPTDDSLATSNELQTVLSLSNVAMATSGNYRNFYYKDGKKYAHTINPKTGYPVQQNILSATVLAPNCATADAFATSFMVMGLEKAKAVLKRHNELKVYILYIDEKGEQKEWGNFKF